MTMRGVAATAVAASPTSVAGRCGHVCSRAVRGITCSSIAGRATGAFDSLPILDLPPTTTAGGSDQTEERDFASRLRAACHNVGFFYVRANHGVSLRTYGDALRASKQFFALDDDAKMAIDYRQSPAFRGYMARGWENTAGRPDEMEQIEFGVEPAAEIDLSALQRPYYMRLLGPNQWPDQHVPALRPCIQQYMKEMEALSRRLMKYLALSLDLPAGYFDDTFGTSPNIQLKVCHYPATEKREFSAEEKNEAMFGVGPHTDSGYLSLLLQDDVGGLQVQNQSGEWIDAPPIDRTIVVNLGEMLQLATSGYFLATPHRVLNVERRQDAAGRLSGRFSMPFFFNPRLDFCMERIDLPNSLVWERPRPAEGSIECTSSHAGGNKLHANYGENAFKSLARSHPQVMERHHQDLIVLPDGTVEKKI